MSTGKSSKDIQPQTSEADGASSALTAAQRARIERNRQKALLLKQARLANHPYAKDGHKVKAPTKVIDSGAGFFIDEDEEERIQAEIKHQPVCSPEDRFNKTQENCLCRASWEFMSLCGSARVNSTAEYRTCVYSLFLHAPSCLRYLTSCCVKSVAKNS